ncbi:hypothetical protein L226DRAFT_612867 [Lentinus tigrinus ALCF2SS1-7]|uniref:Uncharacterized protein n=1 Tax=Lentinus tigrinus ALCF2SS1-6 TaxID=1328759 RepID=A0A5C2SBV3_9APHY|nr:hypothetical protein L227DRAFT_652919 [Lentinus tigrinus ALCF2SS1-6]RPD75232.1 hypothetical protein L226DRAFT_612867 [Lentinus tigrinus ALCF2SS1-7]
MVNSSQSRGPYNLPPGQREVDNMTYNPMADARPDNAAFDEDTDPDMHPVGARGADNQPTLRDYQKEDREAERSEETGTIPRGEVDELLSNTADDERNVRGYTRGNRVDAFKQERALDRAFDETGVSDAQPDVEIGAAVGRR